MFMDLIMVQMTIWSNPFNEGCKNGRSIRRSAGIADDTIVVGDVSVSVNSHKVAVAGKGSI